MTTIINAKSENNELFSLTFDKGIITNRQPQGTGIHSPGSIPLRQFKDNLNKPFEGIIDCEETYLFPAGIDPHVHSRDPGMPNKETWLTLAQAAYHGGVTRVVDMPNTLPPTLDEVSLKEKIKRAQESGLGFRLFLGVNANNVRNLKVLLEKYPDKVCGVKIFYGHSTGQMMFDDLALLDQCLPKNNSFQLVFHAEDQKRIDQNKQRFNSHLADQQKKDFVWHSAIRDSQAAIIATTTILEWAKKSHRRIHIAHVSTAEEVALVSAAKNDGYSISSEVAPHHIYFSTDDYERLGSLLKVNPPVRSPEEVAALRRCFAEGQIDLWATDHAPHTGQEKERSLEQAPSGIASIDLFYPLLLTAAKSFGLPLEKAVRMAAERSSETFGFTHCGRLQTGYVADFVAIREKSFKVDQNQLYSKCGICPFHGDILRYQVAATWQAGILKYAGTT